MSRRRKQKGTPANKPSHQLRYHGLFNQGATCYLNSVLQVLFMTEEFKRAVEGPTTTNCKSECIDQKLKTLFKILKKETARTHAITTHLGIIKAKGEDEELYFFPIIMEVTEQCDAAVCFEKILSHTSPEASQIFQGEVINHNKCSLCQTKTESSNTFWSIPLTLADSESDACCVKLEMKHPPEVLTLLLKRFKFDYHVKKCVKIQSKVQIPSSLQIPPNEIQSLTYELYAYVDHFGELRHGHYTVTIKSQEDKKWYHFDDTLVKLFIFFIRSQNVYLAFYRKASAMDAPAENVSEVPTLKAGQQNMSENNVKWDCGAQPKAQKDVQKAEENKGEVGNGLAVPLSKDNSGIRADNDSGGSVSHEKSHSRQDLSKNNQHLPVQVLNDSKPETGGHSSFKQEGIPKQNGLEPTRSNKQITNQHNRVGGNQQHHQGFQSNSKRDEDATISSSQPQKSSMKNSKKEKRSDCKSSRTTERPENPCGESNAGQDSQHFNNVPQNKVKQNLLKINKCEQAVSKRCEQQKADKRKVPNENRTDDEHLKKGEPSVKRKCNLLGQSDISLTIQSSQLKSSSNTVPWTKEAKMHILQTNWLNKSEEELQRSKQNVGMGSERENEEPNPHFYTGSNEEQKGNECYKNDDKHEQKLENPCCTGGTIQKTVQLEMETNRPQSELGREKHMTLTQGTEVTLKSEAQSDPNIDEVQSMFSKLTVKDSSELEGYGADNTGGNKDRCSGKPGLTETHLEKMTRDSVKAGDKKEGSGGKKRTNKMKGTVFMVAGLNVPKR
ncbi:transcript variant X3 [Nothobranchius furzeri]|uniref:Transcript variant X3 n=1 Tax=Nothobranchius furzeri TaxID=105023 RepID=A0A9D2Z1J5_NOTFU|nr:transcript variant X3 [Nothobranchius furzeri]